MFFWQNVAGILPVVLGCDAADASFVSLAPSSSNIPNFFFVSRSRVQLQQDAAGIGYSGYSQFQYWYHVVLPVVLLLEVVSDIYLR
jgi:hypothetical protein